VNQEQNERAGRSLASISPSAIDRRPSPRALDAMALLFLGALCLLPLLTEHGRVDFVPSYLSVPWVWFTKLLIIAVMASAIVWGARGSRLDDWWKVPFLLAALAAFMTGWHWFFVDSLANRAEWQRTLYLDILSHRPEASGQLRVPHQFRLLPYGFVRGLEYLTGDFWFSCTVYRWFFTYWFLWWSYRFACIFVPNAAALIAVLPIVVLYPLSVAHYMGQLTDPLSHALFALALVYIVEDRWIALALTLALGVLAKETAVLLVPAYLACNWRGGIVVAAKTAALGAACVAAYFAARLPLGWSPGYGSINGTEGLMIADNLGVGEPRYVGAVPVVFNYLHPLLFVGSYLPFIAWHWQRIDARLRALYVVLTPLLLFSNLCFGWMYESRNYVPLLPLQATMVIQSAIGPRPSAPGRTLGADIRPPQGAA
jgi:hypothetical protein